MKPCKPNRKLIAWSVLGALEDAREGTLLSHTDECEGCREYYDEISQLARTLSDKGPLSRVQTNELFHQRLVGKLRASERRVNQQEWLPAWPQALRNWKIGAPVAGGGLGLVPLL